MVRVPKQNVQHSRVTNIKPLGAGTLNARLFSQGIALNSGNLGNSNTGQNRRQFDMAVNRLLSRQGGSDTRKLTLEIKLDRVMQRGTGSTARILKDRGKQYIGQLADLRQGPQRINRSRMNAKTKTGVLRASAVNARRSLRERLWNDVRKIVTRANELYTNVVGDNEEDSHLGWELASIRLTTYDQMAVGGGAYTPLPKGLQERYCVFNPETDIQCFQYCLAAHLQPARHRGRLSGYKKHLIDGPDFVPLTMVPKYEKRLGVDINVYGVTPSTTGKGYFPYLVYPHDERAAGRDMETTISLVLHERHYSLITNFAQFATAKAAKGLTVCGACLQTVPIGSTHEQICSKFPPMVMRPSPTKFLEYRESANPGVVIVADFESMLPGAVHVPCAWCLQVLGGPLHEGFGPDSAKDFINCVMQYSSELTVCAFHNLSGYDSHLIIEYLSNNPEMPYELDILPATSEKVIGFTLRKSRKDLVRFIDSASLMPQSLDNLLKNAGKEQKLFYPYEFMDSWDKYRLTELPPIEAFYSSLRQETITQDEYSQALTLMEKCETMREYTMEYIRRDVIGLAEVLTEFRRLTQEIYGVDCCGYWSSPGVSWAAMLKFTNVRIETVAPSMYMWLEGGVRGGISVISKHRAIANENDSIVYFDANNLYGWAMSQKLPLDNYRFVDSWVVDPTGAEGHILEVDLHYPAHIHLDPAHQQYPLGVEATKCSDGTTKLCGNFHDKRNYIVHEQALLYYISKGLEVRKIHKVLRFRQEAWLKPYIEKNSTLRAQAKNEFESDLYKLMNNSVFGKTLENPRNRCAMRLFEKDSEKFTKYASQPHFVSAKELGTRYILANSIRTQMVCNKVPAVGVSILDLSKIHMAKWHHDVVLPRLPAAQLCATDTDSFFYHVPGKREDEIFELLQDTLDTSNFPKKHPLYRKDRKKVPGYFKSEVEPPARIMDGVWLRAKMYSYKTKGEKGKDADEDDSEECGAKGEHIRAKGIVRKYVSKHMRHQSFIDCFESRDSMETLPFSKFVTKAHKVKTETFTKVGLSCFDDKRIQCDDGVHTMPHGISEAGKQAFKQTILGAT